MASGQHPSPRDEAQKRAIDLALAQTLHELRTPLISARNSVRWLEKSLSEGANSRVAKTVRSLKADLLFLSMAIDNLDVSSREYEEATARTVVKEVVQDVVSSVRPALETLGIGRNSLKVSYRGLDSIPPLNVDQRSLEIVVRNLFMNAIKYRRGGPGQLRIDVSARTTPEHVELRFSDWGLGVPDEFRDQIFTSGFRAPNVLQSEAAGLGIGLFVAREASERIGGELRLEKTSDPTSFSLVLPTASSHQSDDHA